MSGIVEGIVAFIFSYKGSVMPCCLYGLTHNVKGVKWSPSLIATEFFKSCIMNRENRCGESVHRIQRLGIEAVDAKPSVNKQLCQQK